jgi:hypothetical protein
MRLIAVTARQSNCTQGVGCRAHHFHGDFHPTQPDIRSRADSERLPEYPTEVRGTQLSDSRQGFHPDGVFQVQIDVGNHANHVRWDLL